MCSEGNLLMVRHGYGVLALIVLSTLTFGCRKKESEDELQAREAAAKPASKFFELWGTFNGVRQTAGKNEFAPPYFVVELRPPPAGQGQRYLYLETAHSTRNIEQAATVVLVKGGTRQVHAAVQKDKATYRNLQSEKEEHFEAMLIDPKDTKRVRFLKGASKEASSWQKLLEQGLDRLK